MLADSIQAKFLRGIRMPDDLRRLCAFAEEQGNAVSGCIELVPDTAGGSAISRRLPDSLSSPTARMAR